MRTALFAGSFDPPTLGHWDIIQRAAKLFDKLYIVVGVNSSKKKAFLSASQRVDLLKKLTNNLKNIEVLQYEGLTVDLAQQLNVLYLVRGIRNSHDFENESILAGMNKSLTGVETVLLATDERYRAIQAHLIHDIARSGKRLHQFVPEILEEEIFSVFSSPQR